ncbi:MAG: hypothetical protein QXW79_00230 [Thermoplasmata archaeon]
MSNPLVHSDISMEIDSINTDNQNTTMEKFQKFSKDFLSFVENKISFTSHQKREELLQSFDEFRRYFRNILIFSNTYKFEQVFSYALNLLHPSEARNNLTIILEKFNYYRDFEPEIQICSVETNFSSCNMEVEDFVPIHMDKPLGTTDHQTFFSNSNMEVEVEDFIPIHLERSMEISDSQPYCPNGICIVLDGMNFFSRISDFINGRRKDLSLMEVDRNVYDHEFNSEDEIERVLNYTTNFFEHAIPPGAMIYVIIKHFHRQIWNVFENLLIDKFLNNQNLTHKYYIYQALPSHHVSNDRECDDRLVIKLAAKLGNGRKNEVYIISNDRYGSIQEHWNFPTKYLDLGTRLVSDIKNIYPGKKCFVKSYGFGFRINYYCSNYPEPEIYLIERSNNFFRELGNYTSD